MQTQWPTMLSIFTLIYSYIRPFIKWFLRRFTRLCELQRICYGCESGAPRKKRVEESLTLSRLPKIRNIVTKLNDSLSENVSPQEFHEQLVPHAISVIMTTKRIKAKIHPDFSMALSTCIESIWSYRRLCAETEELRQQTYDPDNFDHEAKLLTLWNLLMPLQPLDGRISKQWQDIGFQGDNPASDFRGMGMLGLENLLYFAKEYNAAARYVLSHSLHPDYGYTFAIVGINLTSMAYNLLHNGKAKTHLYNLKSQHLSLKHFHRFYCYLFYEFDKFWVQSKPASLMDFSRIHAEFLNEILLKLNDNRIILNINFSVDNI